MITKKLFRKLSSWFVHSQQLSSGSKSPLVYKSLSPPLATTENRHQLPSSSKSSLVHRSLPSPPLATIGNRQQLSPMSSKSPFVHKSFSSLTLKSLLQLLLAKSLSLLENLWRYRYLPSSFLEILLQSSTIRVVL